MVKRGLITDLARVSHALNFSSPSMAATVNAALKPLETLSRTVNQPTGLLPPTQRKAKPKNEESRNLGLVLKRKSRQIQRNSLLLLKHTGRSWTKS